MPENPDPSAAPPHPPGALRAGLLAELQTDPQVFLELLASALQGIAPDQVVVRRGGGWLNRDRGIRELEIDLGDHRFGIKRIRGGHVAATRTRLSRGIALRTEGMTVESWLDELADEMRQWGRSHREAMEALRDRLW